MQCVSGSYMYSDVRSSEESEGGGGGGFFFRFFFFLKKFGLGGKKNSK